MLSARIFIPVFFLLLSACAGRPPPEALKVIPKAGAPYHFLLAELAGLEGRPAEALREVEKALTQDPDNGYLLYKKAALLGMLGRLEEAEKSALHSIEQGPKNDETLTLLGKIYQSQGKRQKAYPYYLKALQLQPDSEELNLLLMESYLADHRYSDALQLVRQWQKRRPEDSTPYFYEASIYENLLKDKARAVQSYRKVLEIEPGNVKVLTALAELYISLGQKEKAQQIFGEMEKQTGDIPTQLQLALLYYQSRQYTQAAQKFKEILEEYPDSDRVRYYLGVIYENTNQDNLGLEQFSGIGPQSSFFKDAVLHQAFLHHRNGRDEEAEKVLREGIGKKRREGMFYQYWADLLRQQGRFEEVVSVLKQAISRSEDKEPLYYFLGATYEKMGNFEEGMRQMRRVLALNPENANALNFIGYSYADRGMNLAEAETMLRKALSLKPDDGFIIDSLGWVLFKQGKTGEALQLLQKAHRLVPREATIIEHLGDIYQAIKQPSRAVRYYDLVLTVLKGQEKEHGQDLERVRQKIQSLGASHP